MEAREGTRDDRNVRRLSFDMALPSVWRRPSVRVMLASVRAACSASVMLRFLIFISYTIVNLVYNAFSMFQEALFPVLKDNY